VIREDDEETDVEENSSKVGGGELECLALLCCELMVTFTVLVRSPM
jgi:hypothetical protein